MGNAHGREDAAEDPAVIGGSNAAYAGDYGYVNRRQGAASSESIRNSPPDSPGGRSRQPPVQFASEFPLAPLRSNDGPLSFRQTWHDESQEAVDLPSDKGIPALITWTLGGNNVVVQGSWDNWEKRWYPKRSGKDHSLLLVLPSGIYHYRFIVDGEYRYIPDLPCATDHMGQVCNVLDVHDYVPECLDIVGEFQAPASPDSSYGREFPGEDDFAKDPSLVPPQLEATVHGKPDSIVASPTCPHVVLNHLFIEKGWAPQSVVALSMTHRFQSKYVSVVLYKPLKR